ncbi:MAG: glycosyltransferase family 4 protein [Clostridiales bacterium]|nr:glycosyltransferase family 4 protein [Clostridiales bacterium]
MRILFSTSSLVPYRVNWLDELGKYADVDVYYLKENDNERNAEWCSMRPENCKYTLLKSKKLPKLGEVSRGFVKVLKKHAHEYDVILLDGYGYVSQMINLRYLNKKKIPYFVNIDGIVPSDKKKGLTEKLKRKIISKVPYFLCGSKKTNEILLEYGSKEERIFNHPFTSLYEKEIMTHIASDEDKGALRKKLGITEKKVIISVGRFSYMNGYGKGYDVLLKTAQKLDKDIGWYIVGGQPNEEFAKLTKESGLTNFHYIDFKKKDELLEYYRASDLFVLMTVSDVWGLVVNEAMACGLPVITTDKCMAGLDLVEEGANGHIVSVGDDTALKEKVESLFADESKLKEAGKESLRIIKEYTIENLAKTHIDIFKKVMKDEGKADC